MKKLFTTIAISILYIFVQAQQPYPPAPPAAGNITAIEYFIDINPAFGSGTALTGFTASPNINGFTGSVNITGLTPGFHRIYFRTRDVNGIWSISNNNFFDNYTAPVYPAAGAATNINNIEYFIDGNAAFGAGTAITGFTPATDINGFATSIDLTGITPGYHRIYLRSKNANEKWSLTNYSVFDNSASLPYPAAPAPGTNMVQLEYFLDNNDLGFGNCTQIPFTPGTDISNLNANINITGLTPGVHRLFIRGKDANGKWCLTNYNIFDNSASLPYPPAPPPVTNMVQLEYFLDNNDLGFGNCTQIPFTLGTDISNLNANINITGLTAGVHRLFIRGKDANGKWSLTNYNIFDNSSAAAYPPAPPPVTNMVQLEYFFDNNDLGFGNCTQIAFTPGTNISNLNTNVNITGLTPGVHRLFIRGKDATGNWSLTNYSVFDNSAANGYPTAPAPPTPIVNMEYYVDSDPGFGNATAISITPGVDISNLAVNVNTTGLTSGTHRLYIRSKNNNGQWSLSNIDTFAVGLIQVSPDSLLFANTIIGNNAVGNISITNTSGSTQTINNITVAAPFSVAVSTPININGGQVYNLPVTFTPTAAQLYRDTIKLQTTAGNFNVILKGTGTAVSASWTISPAGGHNYNNVAINTTNNFNFTIYNTGNIPVSLNTATINDGAFVPTYTTGTTIPVNGNITLPVAFTPTAVNAYSGQLKIKSTTPGVDSVTTVVSGNGYAPGAPPVIQFVSAAPYNGSTGVNPAVGQTGLFTYKILYKSVNNLPPKAGFPKAGIDLNGNQNFNDQGEGIFGMTKEGTSTDYVTGVVYTYTFNHTNNSSTLGYRFSAQDENGNVATTVNTAYVSGPIVTDQVLDLKIFANNITYSVANPLPGQSFSLTAVVTNSTAVPAVNVPVKFYRDTILLDSAIIPVVNPFATASITQPFNFATEGFYPIKVYINPDQTLPESNYLNNYAIRPIIVGSPNLPGGITVTNSASVQICPQLKIINSGHAVYYGTALPTVVAGAQVTINTGAGIITTTTNVNGDFYYELTGVTCGGNIVYTISVTDFTFTSNTLTVSTNLPCPPPNACAQPPSQGGVNAAVNPNPCANQVGNTATVNFIMKYRERDINNMWSPFDEIIKDTLKVFMDGVLYQTYPSADYSHGPGNEVIVPVNFSLTSTTPVVITGELKYTYIEYLQIPSSTYHGTWIPMVQTGGVTVTPASNLPDLNIEQFTQTGFTSFQFYNANKNCSAAGAHVVEVYDSIPGGSFNLIKTSNYSTVPGKLGYLVTYSDINMTAGVHFIKIITDVNATVVEEVETNNEFITSITVPAPDLTVTKIINTATALSTGSPVVFKATIKNSGKHSTGFKVQFLAGGTQLGVKKTVSSLNENDFVTVTSDTLIVTNPENSCGPVIKVVADIDGDITESDENNNELSVQFSADIRPYQLSNEIGSAGNPVIVRVNTTNQFFPAVRNTGMRDVNNVTVKFVLSGNTIGTGNIASIKAGEVFAAYSSFTQMFTTAGDYVVTVIADTANTICESNEANNSGSFHIRVTDSKMDFEVLSQYISPSSLNPNAGQTITLVGTVRNTGGQSTTANVLRFLVDDIQLGADVPINALLPGRDTTVAATASYSSIIPGVKIMKLVADINNTAVEEREDNNTATRALIVGDAPDMAKTAGNAISFNPSGFRTGDSVLISYSIRNNGPTTGTAWVRFLILDPSDAVTAIDSVQFTLAAGANTIISKRMLFDIEKGTVIAQIANCSPIEFDLTNNEDALPFSTVAMLTSNITVSNDLDMIDGLPAQLPGWIGGKIVLGDYDLIVNGIILNFDTSHFVITNGTGKLKLNNSNPLNIFPVGTNLYSTNFVKVNNSGTPDNFSVRLLPYVMKNGISGDTVLTGNVDCTWLIEEETAGGSNATVEMFWNLADELPGFDRNNSRTAHYISSWQLGDLGPALMDSIGRYSRSQAGYTSFSPFTVTSGTGAVLPLRLLEFVAEKQGTNTLLKWKTADETNSSRFIIQHSITGLQFTDIGDVIALNSPGTNNYQFTHTGISEGLHYYRLKLLDINGSFTYSAVKTVKLEKNKLIQVFPNPVQQFVTIKGVEADGLLEILSLDGKPLQQWKTNSNSITVDIGKLPGGVYFIRYRNKDEVHVEKVIKQ